VAEMGRKGGGGGGKEGWGGGGKLRVGRGEGGGKDYRSRGEL